MFLSLYPLLLWVPLTLFQRLFWREKERERDGEREMERERWRERWKREMERERDVFVSKQMNHVTGNHKIIYQKWQLQHVFDCRMKQTTTREREREKEEKERKWLFEKEGKQMLCQQTIPVLLENFSVCLFIFPFQRLWIKWQFFSTYFLSPIEREKVKRLF